MPNEQTLRAAIAILHYFSDHPKAKDTATGIAKWWTGDDPETVEHALTFLTQEGVVEKRGNIYRLTKTHKGQKMIENTVKKLNKHRVGK